MGSGPRKGWTPGRGGCPSEKREQLRAWFRIYLTPKEDQNRKTVEPLYNEVLCITNDFLYRSNSNIYGKKP